MESETKTLSKMRVHLIGAEVNEVRCWPAKQAVVDKWIEAFRTLIEGSIEDHVDIEVIVIRGRRVELNGGAPTYVS